MLNNQLAPRTFFGFKDFFNNYEGSNSVVPSAYVYEADAGYALEVELPGVKKEDTSIEVEKSVLTVKATRKRGENEIKYERSFRVADEIDVENVKAAMENGVLRVSLTKKKEAEAKKIEVQ